MAQNDMQKEITSRSGIHYFFAGWRLIMLPGIKRYVLLPLLVNIALLGSAFWWLYRQLSQWIPQLMSYVPDWLHWLNYLLWPLCVLAVLLVFGYFFSTVANVIVAPFSGLLAERLETRLTGHAAPDSGLVYLVRDTPRMGEAVLLPATGTDFTGPAFYPGHWPDAGAGAVVFVQRLDAGDSILRLSL